MNSNARELKVFSAPGVSVAVQHQFVSAWRDLESVLVTIEKYQGILFVPSLMGLRSAGRHFLDAISTSRLDDKSSSEKALSSAVDELRRARHDAVRLLVNYFHYKLLLIEENYGSERVFRVCPDYFEIRERIDEVNTRLNQDFSDITSADEFFVGLERDYIPKLLLVFEHMVRAKSAALDTIKQNENREDRYKKLAVAGFGVGLLGVLLAIAAFFI